MTTEERRESQQRKTISFLQKSVTNRQGLAGERDNRWTKGAATSASGLTTAPTAAPGADLVVPYEAEAEAEAPAAPALQDL